MVPDIELGIGGKKRSMRIHGAVDIAYKWGLEGQTVIKVRNRIEARRLKAKKKELMGRTPNKEAVLNVKIKRTEEEEYRDEQTVFDCGKPVHSIEIFARDDRIKFVEPERS